MIGGKNINHKNFYENTGKSEAVIETPDEPVVEPKEETVEDIKKVVEEISKEVDEKKEEPKDGLTEESLYDLTKAEQINYLVDELGENISDAKKLKNEKARVDRILEITNI